MFDDIAAYFYENIWNSYKTYLKVRRTFKAGLSNDLKSAVNLAGALYHLREHIPDHLRKSVEDISNICPDYKLLEAIANASKHKTLTRGNPQLNDASNIYEQIIITEFKDNEGPYSKVEKKVIVKLNNGAVRDIHEILINVLNMWLIEFHNLGFISKINPIKIKEFRIPKRSKASAKMSLLAIKGVRLNLKYKFQRYNYEKGVIEPINLTGSKVSMSIYEPITTICFEAKDNKSGKTNIKFEISLDQKQKQKFDKLKSENEKNIFIVELAKAQGKIKDFTIGTE